MAHTKLMREKYEWVFLNGKQKRVRRAPVIDGRPVDAFIRANADPIWLLQHERYEELNEWGQQQEHPDLGDKNDDFRNERSGEELPF